MKRNDFIYADAMASAPPDPRVIAYMLPWLKGKTANSSSAHRAGAEAAAMIATARKQVSAFWYAEPDEVVFTSGATESCNLALRGLAAAHYPKKKHIISCATEHAAVYATLRDLERYGMEVTFLAPDRNGRVTPDDVSSAIRQDTLAVSLMAVNNETGICHPLDAISTVCGELNVYLHTDATQLPGRVLRSGWLQRADLISFGSHKCYAPTGTGGLIMRRNNGRKPPLTAQMTGGGHEGGIRSGTHNTAGIAGLGKAFELLAAEEVLCIEKLQMLTAAFFGVFTEPGMPYTLTGGKPSDAAGCISMQILNLQAVKLLSACQQAAFSTGSACSSGHGGKNRVLAAMGMSDTEAASTIRISFSRFNEIREAEALARYIAEKMKDLLN